MKLQILEQSKDFVAIHKPAGFLTYAETDSQKKISAQFFLEHQIGKKILPVHRLDKGTCGILLYALSKPAAEDLGDLFREHRVEKKYQAIVHGHIEPKGEIITALRQHKGTKDENAHTDFIRLRFAEREIRGEKRAYSLVSCAPKTGRYHQIRRHLKSIGHPIIGDEEYGNSWENEAFAALFELKRALLSSVEIKLPWKKKNLKIRTQPDPDFQKIAKLLFG